MAILNWIGKEAVVNHDKEVAFKLLEKVPSASVGKESKNLVIHGDNLEALKALMPFYKSKVKCIYIDPPYNTGNEGWVYNDKVNSPKIREWLEKTVKIDDLTRHDKWLCMMYPRLKLLRDLLDNDGVIFISIDDNEVHHLRCMMNEIFGGQENVEEMVWKKVENDSGKLKITHRFRTEHEYVLVGYKNKKSTRFTKYLSERNYKNQYTNPDNDPRGAYKQGIISTTEEKSKKDGKNYFTVKSPSGKTFTRQWRVDENEFKKLVADNRIYFGKKGDSVPSLKVFINELGETTPMSVLEGFGTAKTAGMDLEELFDGTKIFNYPKPVNLIKNLIQISTKKKDIVLDSFAGSGTTGHAVLELNKDDGGERNFILVEMEDKVAKKVTAERVKRVIKKHKSKDGFEYCELKKPLFNEKGQINEACSYDELASYIYFTETQTNIDKKKIKDPFVGESHDISYYLIYTGKNKNDLTRSALTKLKIKGQAVIYADRCLVDEEDLKKNGIVFKQIPYEIKIY